MAPWRLAVWVREDGSDGLGAGELQVRTAVGECLAVVPLDAAALCAVPPQGGCPAEALGRLRAPPDPPPFVVVLALARPGAPGTAECAAHVAAADAAAGAGPRALRLRRLRGLAAPAPLELAAAGGGLLACRGAAACVLDWQGLRAHGLPGGWEPLAAGPSLLVALAPPRPGRGAELVLLEPP